MYDNAILHTAISINHFLKKQGISELNCPHILFTYSH
jgi:hypothetical protein